MTAEKMQNTPPEQQADMCARIAISVDVDPLYHYFNCRGWEMTPVTNPNAVYQDGLPRFLDIFNSLGIKATLFVVGKDALREENAGVIRRAVEEGHEIASHSMEHRLDLHTLSRGECEAEIARAEEVLTEATGSAVSGFRAPGWNISPVLFEILESRGYVYDSSVMPGPWIPALRAAHRLVNRRPDTINFAGQKAFPPAPDEPYYPAPHDPMAKGSMDILEIPAGVAPGLRLPFYGTARLALKGMLFPPALASIRRTAKYLTFVFHALELVDYHEHICDPRMKVKPGMTLSIERKLEIVRGTLLLLAKRFSPCRMIDVANTFNGRGAS